MAHIEGSLHFGRIPHMLRCLQCRFCPRVEFCEAPYGLSKQEILPTYRLHTCM